MVRSRRGAGRGERAKGGREGRGRENKKKDENKKKKKIKNMNIGEPPPTTRVIGAPPFVKKKTPRGERTYEYIKARTSSLRRREPAEYMLGVLHYSIFCA